MKFLWLSLLFLSQAVLATCPAGNSQHECEAVRIQPLVTPEQKKDALTQLQKFQQALSAKNATKLKTFLKFPYDTYFGVLAEIELPESEPFTEALFDRHSETIMRRLHNVTKFTIHPGTQWIDDYLSHSLTPAEQKRKYYPLNDGRFYYEEKGERHYVTGICELAMSGNISDDGITLNIGSQANEQIPPAVCDGTTILEFGMINGQLKLLRVSFAG